MSYRCMHDKNYHYNQYILGICGKCRTEVLKRMEALKDSIMVITLHWDIN